MVHVNSPIPIENPLERFRPKSYVGVLGGVLATVVTASVMYGVPRYERSKLPQRPERYTQYTQARETLDALRSPAPLRDIEDRLTYTDFTVLGFIASDGARSYRETAVTSLESDMERFRAIPGLSAYERGLADVERAERTGKYAGFGAGGLTAVVGWLAERSILRRRKREEEERAACPECDDLIRALEKKKPVAK